MKCNTVDILVYKVFWFTFQMIMRMKMRSLTGYRECCWFFFYIPLLFEKQILLILLTQYLSEIETKLVEFTIMEIIICILFWYNICLCKNEITQDQWAIFHAFMKYCSCFHSLSLRKMTVNGGKYSCSNIITNAKRKILVIVENNALGSRTPGNKFILFQYIEGFVPHLLARFIES